MSETDNFAVTPEIGYLSPNDEKNKPNEIDQFYKDIVNEGVSTTIRLGDTAENKIETETPMYTAAKPTESLPTTFFHKKLTIQNLPWWTSDQDVENAIRQLGINDTVDMVFKENKVNGVSKGIVTIELSSEDGYNALKNSICNVEFYGHKVAIADTLHYTSGVLSDIHSVKYNTQPLVGTLPIDGAETQITKPLDINDLDIKKPSNCKTSSYGSNSNPFLAFINGDTVSKSKDRNVPKRRRTSSPRQKRKKRHSSYSSSSTSSSSDRRRRRKKHSHHGKSSRDRRKR